jgi:membrane protein implicated in regulation of membrane protease activity
MDQPETWRWIWLTTAVVFAVGELAIAGSFFLAPFAIGAAVAAILAFAEVDIIWQWVAFVGISFTAFAGLRPLARRLDQGEPTAGIGSKRLIGQSGNVLEAIPAGLHELGMVRIQREEWRAETASGEPIEAGAVVQVVEQRGTRLVVTRGPGEPTTALPARPPIADPPKEP